MSRFSPSLVASAKRGAMLVAGLAIAVALVAVGLDRSGATSSGEAASSKTSANPPRPLMRSHGVRIRAARIGYCTREQIERDDGCALPDVFKGTRPLAVHPRGHVFVRTRVEAAELRVNLFCGKTRPGWKLAPGRWVFHVNGRQGTLERCDGGSLTIKYAESTEFAGGISVHTFSTKPHRH